MARRAACAGPAAIRRDTTRSAWSFQAAGRAGAPAPPARWARYWRRPKETATAALRALPCRPGNVAVSTRPTVLLDGGRIVEGVRAFDREGADLKGVHRLLDSAGLRDQAVDGVLDDLVALGIAVADHLVVFHLAAVGGVLEHAQLDLGIRHRLFHALVGVGRCGRHELGQARALHDAAVDPLVAAFVDRDHAHLVVVVGVVRVVGEAVMLLLRVVQDEAELHALARQLAIAEAAEAGQHHAERAVAAGIAQRLAGRAVGRSEERRV